MPLLLPVIIFAAVASVILGAYWLAVVVPENREQSALRRRLIWQGPEESRVQLLKDPEVLSRIGSFDVVLKRLERFSVPLQALLAHANVRLTVGAFLMLSTCVCFAGATVTMIYVPRWWAGLSVGVAAAFVPLLIVRHLRTRRVRLFESQFPEAIDLIGRAMRAGHAFATGLKMAADELPAPVGAEFRTLYELQNYGAQLPDALRTFGSRIPSLDARFFVTAVLTQRESGGNLAEVLDRLAAVMRERFKIKREVRVRSAHGRITASVLAGLPPTIAVMMLIMNPEPFKLLVGDPLGVRMIIGAVVLQIIGTLIVRKLVSIEY